MKGPLLAWVINVNWMELQKSLLDTWKFFSRFLNTLNTCDNYSVVSRDNWMQTIQRHLSQKQNVLSQFFAAFFELALNFEHFQKKMTLIAYVFSKVPSPKDALRLMSKSSVWDACSRDDMGNGRKHWFNLNERAFIILIDDCEGNRVRKVTLSDMKCLNTFC